MRCGDEVDEVDAGVAVGGAGLRLVVRGCGWCGDEVAWCGDGAEMVRG